MQYRTSRALRALRALLGSPKPLSCLLLRSVFRISRPRHGETMKRELRGRIQAKARELLYGGKALNWREALAAADQSHRCNAQTKSTGEPCRARPISGRKRCRLHGGLTPTHRTPAQKEAQRRFVATQPRVGGRWAKRSPSVSLPFLIRLRNS